MLTIIQSIIVENFIVFIIFNPIHYQYRCCQNFNMIVVCIQNYFQEDRLIVVTFNTRMILKTCLIKIKKEKK